MHVFFQADSRINSLCTRESKNVTGTHIFHELCFFTILVSKELVHVPHMKKESLLTNVTSKYWLTEVVVMYTGGWSAYCNSQLQGFHSAQYVLNVFIIHTSNI